MSTVPGSVTSTRSAGFFSGRLAQLDGDDRHFLATLPTVLEDECAALELAVGVPEGVDAGQRIDLMHSGMRASDAV